MKRNEGPIDRFIRAIIGLALIAVSFAAAGAVKIVLIVIGAVALVTAATGFCLLYTLLGIDTSKKK
jgi:uncharacterized membrane protein